MPGRIVRIVRWFCVFVVVFVSAFAVASRAEAGTPDETALAERYAPVVRLVEQEQECGYGEPYHSPRRPPPRCTRT